MKPEILEYLKTQRVGVLAVEMMDGSPHGATLNFAHTEDPLVFYFETSREYRKAESLLKREKTRATFVVGTVERSPKTFQLDGIAELLKSEEMELFDSVYLEKFPEKKSKARDNRLIFFKFVPMWWRFTDWTGPGGKIILTSMDNTD